ncbi:UNVERIFIED_ORG: hypothetical protein M2348_003884 [Sphingomonas sp. R1F5B]
MGTLHLRFEREDEFHGQLFATVSSMGFAGAAAAWFATAELYRFSQACSAYPLNGEALPHIAGGFLSREPGTSEPEQVHLGIDVAPHDLQGNLRVTVRLATEVLRTEKSDLGCNVTVRFVTTYSEMGPFASAMLALVEGEVKEAVLKGINI